MIEFTEDKELLLELNLGNKSAYKILFKKYYSSLCAYANHFVEFEDAEEIAQEVMLWLWESCETKLIKTSLRAYLYRMTYHKALNLISHNKTMRNTEMFFYEKYGKILEDKDYDQFEELVQQTKEAIEELPLTYKEAFVFHYFYKLSYKEIAMKLDVSSKTIDYRIQRALKQLRKIVR